MKWKCGITDDEVTFSRFMAKAPEFEIHKAMSCLLAMSEKSPNSEANYNSAQAMYEKRFGGTWAPF